MGLASALSTALTGLNAAETTIDLVGNNLANSNTVGYKASEVSFATQFLQTLSLGSGPTENSGGTNPKQIGLGTMVADITPNFNQGTIEISSNPLDLAIQGDGFFMVQGGQGETFYTRNGLFKTNADYEVVTITGHRLMGYGIDDNYQIQRTTLTPIQIPLGAKAVAQATGNVFLEGTLTPNGDLADTPSVIQTGTLGNGRFGVAVQPDAFDFEAADKPTVAAPSAAGGGTLAAGVYSYRFVFATDTYAAEPVTGEGNLSEIRSATLDGTAAQNAVSFGSLPANPGGPYEYLRIYRADPGAPDRYYFLDELDYSAIPASYLDDGTQTPDPTRPLNDTQLSGTYRYAVVLEDDKGVRSRPCFINTAEIVDGGSVELHHLPKPDPSDPTNWVKRYLYRTTGDRSDDYYLVDEIPGAVSDDATVFVDSMDDTTLAAREKMNWDGPKIDSTTFLVNVLRRDGEKFENVFEKGTLEFTGRKGGRSLATKSFEIGDTTTVADLALFLEQAMGIQKPSGIDEALDIPGDPRAWVENGQIKIRGNNGYDNRLDIGLSGMLLRTATGTEPVNMPWSTAQEAKGQSAVTDFIAYDSLGSPIRVRMTAVLQERTDTATVYRWFADSPDNLPLEGADIAVGSGLITFDGEGNFISSSESTVSIQRRGTPAASPLEFELDFTALSGLAANKATLAVSRQDGSAPGVLTSFIISETGVIRGVFSNGVSRDLGQLRLSRFANPAGLEQLGQNLYAEGVDSGLPVQGDPGEQGIGTIIAGARELSNTDIGKDLIELILASTMYRGNTRVITTSQQMLDELLAIRR